MPKLALNFICKNEENIIERMLNSSKGIFDLIVAVDTGSTDKTIQLIYKYGLENNIPTYVFERSFDSFDKSRNFALTKLRDVIKEIEWDSNDSWGMWYDCDEELVINENFNKNQFKKDIYMVNTHLNSMKYTRNTFFRISMPFFWYGVVHEYIICEEKNITSGLAENIHIIVSTDGSSWKENISNKYLKHAHILEQYISNDRKDPRWIFYTAQSYHDSASIKDNKEENEERLRRSLKYYNERIQRRDGYYEEISYSQYRIACIMELLEEPWNIIHQEYLKAYNMDVLRAEPIKGIIDHYMNVNEWDLAYLYTKFSIETFQEKNPYPKRLLFIDQSLYEWSLLEAHSAACFYTNRKDDAFHYFSKLLDVSTSKRELFTESDLKKIENNKKYLLK